MSKLIESVLGQLDHMTRYSRLDEERSHDEGAIPEKGGTEEYKTIDKDEFDPDFSQEHHTQNMLFGINDYIPFGSKGSLKEAFEPHPTNNKRMVVKSDVPGPVAGLVVPKHMWEGGKPGKTREKATVGMRERNAMRAKVYGPENRAPLSLTAIERTHKETLDDHFSKPHDEQIAAEKAAISRLQKAGHLDSGSTLDKGEKTDTVQNERDEKGRTFVGMSSKGVAGHALYTSGHGSNEQHHIINTCPQQTKGCGGGVDSHGVADTLKGTCFAPRAEAQYVNASIRRATHEQAKHDPAMTKDWVLAHTHSLRTEAEKADTKNKRFLFRPNVVDETDRSSRHVIKHLNAVRSKAGKPPIVANSYGKTDELHDPANNYHVTFSNTGPKVKHGGSVLENKKRDRTRIRQTITATDAKGGDLKNEEGKNVPPKNSYMVTDMKRGGEMDKKFQASVTHAKYWSAPRTHNELSDSEKSEPAEAHYDGNGKLTTPDKAHYGHKTITGEDGVARRYDYQKQHILHPRLVPVTVQSAKGGSETHHIPTDSRFKDDEYLPPAKDRFKTKNGKVAGAIMTTTPTTSTSDVQHHSNFTHHVSDEHIEHAKAHGGEYEIDKPEHQEAARNASYLAPFDASKAKAEKKAAKSAVKITPPKPNMAALQATQKAKSDAIKASPEFQAKMANVKNKGLSESIDKMISFRQKIDAKRLVPSRSGSKGGDGGAGDGGAGGGAGGNGA